MNKRIVITGIGVIAPNGLGSKDFLKAIQNGKSGIKFIQELSDFNFSCQVAGIPNIKHSKYLEYLHKYDLTESDITVKYSTLAALEAWTNAGFQIPEYFSDEINENCGIIIGSSCSGMEYFARRVIPLTNSRNIKKLGSRTIENIMTSGPVATISMILALGNQSMENSSACSSGTESIILAYESIKSGKAEIMLAGGTDPNTPFCWAGFDSMRLLNRKSNKTPESASRPMSASANGFVPAAGAGIIILEELSHAQKRNATIYAEIIGGSTNCGGHRNGGSMYASNPNRAVDNIKQALKNSEIEANNIDLISGHLTGTKSDPREIENWIAGLNLKNKFPYINSLKSMTGHMQGAAGTVETIAAVLQLQHSFIHPSINCEDLHPEIQKIYDNSKIPHKPIFDSKVKYAIKAGFGFGDVNSCIVLKSY